MSINKIYILIICDLPEIANYKDMNIMGYEILSSFKIIATKNNKKLNVIDIISDRCINKCINGLKKMAKYLNESGNKGIVYYYGHSLHVKNLNGDDGMGDEHTPQNISDVNLSHIFNTIHPSSVLYMFIDSLSSSQIIDLKLNDRNWVTISSANDIGVFTIWGIFPALEALYNPTPVDLHAFIKSNISTDTLITFDSGNDTVINQRMF